MGGFIGPIGGGGGGGGGGGALPAAATWTDLPATGAEGGYAYLTDAQILLRWSDDVDPLDSDGRRWVPDAIYSDSTGTGVVAGVVEWLEPIDCASVGDGQPVETWTNRAGTGDYTAAGTARPTFDADGGADGGAAVVFDGANNYMSKGSGLDSLAGRTAYTISSLNRPASVDGAGFLFLASHNGTNFARFALARSGAGSLVYYDYGGTNVTNTNVPAQGVATETWGVQACHLSAAGIGTVPRGATEQAVGTNSGAPSPCAGASDYIRIGAWRNGAEPTVTDPWGGRMGPLIVMAGTGAPNPGAARAVAAWLSSRAGLL